MRVQIPIGGISTTSQYKDGDLFSAVNLRKKYGALHPVAPRKVVGTISEKYDIIFVHSINDTENWIGIIHNGVHSSIYHTIKDTRVLIGTVDQFPKITAIEQIGNTLSLITNESILYLLWNEGGYKVLGEIPEIPIIEIASFRPSATSIRGGITTTYYTNGLSRLFSQDYPTLSAITSSNFVDSTKGLINSAISQSIIDKTNQFTDAFFIRYAFRLFDGTLIKHSSPILAMPPFDILKLMTVDYRIYNGSLALDSVSGISIHQFCLQLSYDTSTLSSEWIDIIKSIDIFISPNIGISSSERIRGSKTDDYIQNFQLNSPYSGEYLKTAENVVRPITSAQIDVVKNQSSFYLAKSINIGDANTNQLFPNTDEERTTIINSNLIFKEVMTDDNFTHNKIGSSKSYVYNGRLNLAGIKETIFQGFNYNMFKLLNDSNGVTRPALAAYNYEKFKIEVEFNNNGTKNYLYSESDFDAFSLFASSFVSYPDTRAVNISFWKASTDLTGTVSAYSKIASYKLTPHNFLNLSYYLNESLLPITEGSVIAGTVGTPTKVVLSEPNKLKVSSLNNPFNFPSINTYTIGNGRILGLMSNAMRTSDGQFGQYPMMAFTNERIYALNVGSGEVVYSNITPISNTTPILDILCQTPFGVVFVSNRGLYTINGQEVNFLSSQIEQEPLPLLFNEMIAGVSTGITALTDGAIQNFNQASFIEYTQGITNIVFNPLENELIICNSNFEYNYVYNVDSQMFYQSTEVIDVVVGNTYPNLFVTQNGSTNTVLKDYYLPEPNSQVQASFITRPITFTGQILDIKRLDRMLLRAKIDNATKMSAIVHSSDDGVAFNVKRGMSFAPNYYRDILLGLIGKNKHRQFCYAWGGTIDSTTQLTMIEADVLDEYNNDKMM